MCHSHTVLCGRWMPANDWASLQVLQAMEQICFHQRWPRTRSFTLQKMLWHFWRTLGFALSESFKQELGFTVQTLHLQLQRHRVNKTTTARAGSNLFVTFHQSTHNPHRKAGETELRATRRLPECCIANKGSSGSDASDAPIPSNELRPQRPVLGEEFRIGGTGSASKKSKTLWRVGSTYLFSKLAQRMEIWSQAVDCKKIIEKKLKKYLRRMALFALLIIKALLHLASSWCWGSSSTTLRHNNHYLPTFEGHEAQGT